MYLFFAVFYKKNTASRKQSPQERRVKKIKLEKKGVYFFALEEKTIFHLRLNYIVYC